jgi:hypothetical protein
MYYYIPLKNIDGTNELSTTVNNDTIDTKVIKRESPYDIFKKNIDNELLITNTKL